MSYPSYTVLALVPAVAWLVYLQISQWRFKRYAGRFLGRVIGALWSLLVLIGLGNSVLGVFNTLFLGYAFRRWSGVGYPYDGLAEGSTDSTESLLESGSISHT